MNINCVKSHILILLAGVTLLAISGCSRNRDQHPIQHEPIATSKETPAIWPVDHPARLVTSGFGMRHSSGGAGGRMHNGVDMTVPMNTPVVVTANGLVSFSGTMRGYGDIIIVDHANLHQTAYAHLNKRKVDVGERVKRGQVIGLSGQSGNATAPHVHYEVRRNGVAVDPMPYLGK